MTRAKEAVPFPPYPGAEQVVPVELEAIDSRADHAPNHTGLAQAICPFSWVTRR